MDVSHHVSSTTIESQELSSINFQLDFIKNTILDIHQKVSDKFHNVKLTNFDSLLCIFDFLNVIKIDEMDHLVCVHKPGLVFAL